MQCRALHEGAVSSRNHVSWRRNRVSVKCQCPRYLTGALPCRRRSARPADRPARPAMNRLGRPCSSPAAFPGRCPARGEQFAEDGRNGSRLSGHLRQFGQLCHADGARPAVRPSARPERPAPRQDAPFRKGRMRRSGGVPGGSCPWPGTRSGRGCATHRFPLWRTSPKSGTRPRSIKVRRS